MIAGEDIPQLYQIQKGLPAATFDFTVFNNWEIVPDGLIIRPTIKQKMRFLGGGCTEKFQLD